MPGYLDTGLNSIGWGVIRACSCSRPSCFSGFFFAGIVGTGAVDAKVQGAHERKYRQEGFEAFYGIFPTYKGKREREEKGKEEGGMGGEMDGRGSGMIGLGTELRIGRRGRERRGGGGGD